MSGISYPPPSENLPIFDSSVFQPTETAIDSNTGLKYFLAYPNAQGTENLQAINVLGLANFDDNIIMNGVGNYLQFPDGTQQTTAGGTALLSSNNIWTGTNKFNQTLTLGNTLNGNTILISPSTATNNLLNVAGQVVVNAQTYPNTTNLNYLATIGFVNSAGSSLLTSNNTWTGTNDFNTNTPTSSVSQTYPQTTNTTRLSTIGYVNGILGGTNSWTGTNTFNTNTTGITQTAGNNTTKLATTAFVQSAVGGSSILGSNNTWTGTNDFTNTTTALTPTLGDNTTKVATTAFINTAVSNAGYASLTLANTFSGTQLFNANMTTQTINNNSGGINLNGTTLSTRNSLSQTFTQFADYATSGVSTTPPYNYFKTPQYYSGGNSAGYFFQIWNGSAFVNKLTVNLAGVSATNATLTETSNALTFGDSSVQNSAFTDQFKSNISPILNSTSSSNLVINQQLQLTDGTITATFGPTGISTNNPSGLQVASNIDLNSNNINNGGTITATTFVGALTGTATNSTNSAITDDNTNATFYPVFVSNNTGNLPLKVDKTTNALSYNPSTGVLISQTFSGLCDTGGLVYLGTGTASITGSATFNNFNLANIFNATYKNYRIVLAPTTQLTFTAYPAYSLTAFLATGAPAPTIASLYGFEITSSNTVLVAPVYTAGATISSAPLILAVSQVINHQTIIEIENVGYTATATQYIGLKCKSFYGNPGVSGASDRSISASYTSGTTITGLTLQQSSISIGNNMSIGWTIYAYK